MGSGSASGGTGGPERGGWKAGRAGGGQPHADSNTGQHLSAARPASLGRDTLTANLGRITSQFSLSPQDERVTQRDQRRDQVDSSLHLVHLRFA